MADVTHSIFEWQWSFKTGEIQEFLEVFTQHLSSDHPLLTTNRDSNHENVQ